MKKMLIEDLLVKPKEVPMGKFSLWVRPSTDPERTMAAAYARKSSRKLRKELNDPKTEKHRMYILEEIEASDEEGLRRIWVNGKLIARSVLIRTNSLEEREYVPDPLDTNEGIGVTAEQMDKYEDEVDAAEERREISAIDAVQQAQKELEKEAKKIPKKEIAAASIGPLIDTQCNRAYEVEFIHQLIYRATFEDKACKHMAFTNVDEVYSLKDSALQLLTTAHLDLMDDPESVKN